MQQNAMAHAPRQAMRAEIARDIRTVLQAADRGMTESNLEFIIQKYSKRVPRLSVWMETNLPEGLTVMESPESHRRLLRTTNMIERLNQEIRRRTRVVTIFPNVASCQRLISAILMEADEEWQMGKRYLTFPKMEEGQTTWPTITRMSQAFFRKDLALSSISFFRYWNNTPSIVLDMHFDRALHSENRLPLENQPAPIDTFLGRFLFPACGKK